MISIEYMVLEGRPMLYVYEPILISSALKMPFKHIPYKIKTLVNCSKKWLSFDFVEKSDTMHRITKNTQRFIIIILHAPKPTIQTISRIR